MKMSPEYVKAYANMQPGVITSDGFMGDDHRSLTDIIEQDEELVASLDLSWEEMSNRMHHLMQEGRKGLGEPVTVDGTWIVQVSEARGFLASPFEDGIYRKVNADVQIAEHGKATGDRLLFSELSLHLLEKYHFLQGKGSPFRLDPSTLKKVLKY
jgi:hypothetical protein